MRTSSSSSSSSLLSLAAAAAALVLSTSCASASFSNTHTLLAWSDADSANLESFRPHAAKASLAYQLEKAAAAGESCVPALVVSAPSFGGFDDLAASSSSSFIKREWQSAAAALHLPYVSSGSAENLRMMVDRRLGQCSDVHFRKAKDLPKGVDRETKMRWVNELGVSGPGPHYAVFSAPTDSSGYHRAHH